MSSSEKPSGSVFHRWFERGPGRALRMPALGVGREYLGLSATFVREVAEAQRSELEYGAALAQTFARSSQRFAAHLLSKEARGLSPMDLMQRWIDIADETFNEEFRTPEYAALQAGAVNSAMRAKATWRRLLEVSLKAYDLPTRGEVEELEKDLAETKREVRRLRRALEAMRDGRG